MDGDPDEGIFRATVEEADGMPRLAPTATALGVRMGKDIVADHAGLVHRPAFRPGAKNGLSCSRTVHALPRFALPVEWGGLNDRTVVWRIDPAGLCPELVAGDDSLPGHNEHISIGPAVTMPHDDYVRAIEATRSKWKKATKS